MFRKTVDSVLGTFTKAIADLEAIAAREDQAAADKHIQIRTLNAEINEHNAEYDRARKAAARISSLVA